MIFLCGRRRLKWRTQAVTAALGDNIPTLPECRAFLIDEQKVGVELGAKEYYEELWNWLADRKCEHLFQPSYLQNFAMQQARYRGMDKSGEYGRQTVGDAPRDYAAPDTDTRVKKE